MTRELNILGKPKYFSIKFEFRYRNTLLGIKCEPHDFPFLTKKVIGPLKREFVSCECDVVQEGDVEEQRGDVALEMKEKGMKDKREEENVDFDEFLCGIKTILMF